MVIKKHETYEFFNPHISLTLYGSLNINSAHKYHIRANLASHCMNLHVLLLIMCKYHVIYVKKFFELSSYTFNYILFEKAVTYYIIM